MTQVTLMLVHQILLEPSDRILSGVSTKKIVIKMIKKPKKLTYLNEKISAHNIHGMAIIPQNEKNDQQIKATRGM